MIRPKIGLDWDDVTAPFNSIAIDMANKKYNITPPLELEDIDSWENTGRASVINGYWRGLFYHCGGTGLHGSESESDNGGIS